MCAGVRASTAVPSPVSGEGAGSKCQSQPEAGKAATEGRPGRDRCPWIMSSHRTLRFCIARLSLLSATGWSPAFLLSHLVKCHSLTPATTMAVTSHNSRTHVASCSSWFYVLFQSPVTDFSCKLSGHTKSTHLHLHVYKALAPINLVSLQSLRVTSHYPSHY